ncbi:uncharacterized protein LOC129742852 [Uranotaenia lowii]|uniref:uncharacterized protein LOC129742852 n=1 Tax=Uranotaenia lowii TaxID=190385 RepID=UPI002479A535|nr:uncharacterized protein LOC129742852 [Uranotaenia lowii]
MGSPLSPVIASIALERIEKAALEALSERDIIPVFYKRYVDDCLVCAKLNEQQSIMDMFNGMHQRLKFTIEQEVDGKIKFLDMIIRREEDGLTTEWFPKDENGRYLDFGSRVHNPSTLTFQNCGDVVPHLRSSCQTIKRG